MESLEWIGWVDKVDDKGIAFVTMTSGGGVSYGEIKLTGLSGLAVREGDRFRMVVKDKKLVFSPYPSPPLSDERQAEIRKRIDEVLPDDILPSE